MEQFILKYLWPISVIAGIAIGYGIGFMSIYVFDAYGWTIFTVVPFLLGFIPPVVYGFNRKITWGQSLKIGFSTLGIFCLSTLVFAVEGIICILMASPLLAFCTFLGAIVGYKLIEHRMINKGNFSIVLILPVLMMVVDKNTHSNTLLEVKTTIEVEAPIQTVWDNVVSFGEIDEPTDWLFKTGISYPTHAEIVGTGVGAVRHCNFTTGSFVEPITTWEEPTLLQFDVESQPTPMKELNPFWDVHPPHLDGYFQSQKGQFKLTELENGITRIEGTTWYHIHILPVGYWDIWSKFILHKIHYRVLKHIKGESERVSE